MARQARLKKPYIIQQTQILNAIRALGIAKASWLADYFRIDKLDIEIHPENLAKKGLLTTAQIKDKDEIIYAHFGHAALFEKVKIGKLKSASICTLLPFDPIVCNRKRTLELFYFHYKLECYIFFAKRRYCYLTISILSNDALIGHMDARVQKNSCVYIELKALHILPQVKYSQSLVNDLAKTIKIFALWHGIDEIALRGCYLKELNTSIIKQL